MEYLSYILSAFFTISYNDDLFLILYFLLHLFIIFFFFVLLIIERSRSKLLIQNDGLEFEATSYHTVISNGIGAIPYTLLRFFFRPLFLILLLLLIGWSGYFMKWLVMLPAIGIIMLTINFNSPFLRILFPIFILGGISDLLLRFSWFFGVISVCFFTRIKWEKSQLFRD